MTSSFRFGRELFGRALGLTSIFAFLSIWVQIDGLLGPQGVLPAGAYLERVSAHFGIGGDALLFAPTVFWLSASDAALWTVCGLGTLASVLLMAGIAPRWTALSAWFLYLSIVSVGQEFLGYQWDVLLLETLFVGAFYLPGGLRLASTKPTGPIRYVLWALLFKLMFMSGFVKIASGDPSWANLDALDFHFWTQPLPTWASYYAANLPGWMMAAGVSAVLAIELLIPFLIFAPRLLRHIAGLTFIALMLLIMVTGTYGFFNVLAITLCLPLFDDAFLRRLMPGSPLEPGDPPGIGAWLVSGAIFLLVLVPTLPRLTGAKSGILVDAARVVAQTRTFNSYGLFAVMTTERREIVVEWSQDGHHWTPYEFGWKPTDVAQRPDFATPHMPRLDWQMWFAALGSCESNPWFVEFQHHLLKGTPEVLRRLDTAPPDPPKFVRSRLFTYQFGDQNWWQRESLDQDFCPPLTIREGKLTEAIVGAP